jgi:hypothetical protein
MPHAFVMFEKHPSTETCYKELAKFAKDVTSGRNVETRMEIVNGKGVIQDQPLDVETYPIAISKPEVWTFLGLG